MICLNCGKVTSDDSLFCEQCGRRIEKSADEMSKIIYVGEPKPFESKGASKKSKGKNIVRIAAAVVLAVSLIGNITLGTRLGESQAELEQSAKALEKSQSDVSKLEAQVSSLEYNLNVAQDEIDSLSDAGVVLDNVSKFAHTVAPKSYQKYSDLYTYSNAVIIKQGKTEEIHVVWTRSYSSVYWNCDDTNIVSPQWADNWSGDEITLYVTGQKAGTAIITISNDKNDHELQILVIVTE